MNALHGKKQPTLKTVAEMTGVSLSTVSACMRDGSSVKKSTREKVLQAARQVGYVPNRAGVRLRTGRTNVLTLVLSADKNSVDFTRLLIQGIGAHIEDSQFNLNVVPEFERSDPVASVRFVLENRSSDGIILTHTSARDPRVQMLMDAEFPFVSHGRTEFYSPHPFHDFNAEGFIAMAVGRVVANGRRNPILAVVDNKTTNYTTNVTAFQRALAATGVPGTIYSDPVALNTSTGARECGRWIAAQPEPHDAIICNNELTAMAIMGGLQDKGIFLRRDYDLICKQTTDILPTLYPHMDTIAEDLFASGSALAETLIRRIQGVPVKDLQTFNQPIPVWRNQ